jgi:hypothetical protein
MKTKIKKTVSACALFFLGVFVLNLTACKKETMTTATNQSQLRASANVQSNAVTDNEKVNIDLFVSIPCANGGAGEDVQLSGFLHVLFSFTINGNNVRGKYHFQPQGISGTGLITGDKYQATGGTQDEFKGSFVNGQYEESFVNNFRIIGQSNGNNFLIHENFHITINANGVVTTVIDNFTADCK